MKNNAKENRQVGFTLIEIMMVIALIGILSIVTIVSMRSRQNQNKLKVAQAETEAIIKQAQSYALQGKKQGNVVPKYYGIKFSADGKSYSFCINSNDLDVDCSNPIESYQFKNGVMLSAGQGTQISFDVPYGNCRLSSASDNLTVTFKLDNSSRGMIINKGGAITEN
jgi:prepilin-type N-terminal cleavage/methylation domain-containing protein